eukprot:220498-Prymnesium_polylepis.1
MPAAVDAIATAPETTTLEGCMPRTLDPTVTRKKKKKNTVRTDRPTPDTLALIGDSRASLSRVVRR